MSVLPTRPLRACSDLPVGTAADVRELDRHTIEACGVPGIVLMEHAAVACCDRVLRRHPTPVPVTVLVGPGNNGGDGSAIARLLDRRGWPVTIILAADPARIQGDAAIAFNAAAAAGVRVIRFDDHTRGDAADALRRSPVWIDALLGTGAAAGPRGTIGALLALASDVRGDLHGASGAAGPFVLAVDLPSGVVADTGAHDGPCLHADETVTFGCPRVAHLAPAAIAPCGDVLVADIGLQPASLARFNGPTLFGPASAAATFRPRPRDAHKSTSGRVVVDAGSPGMPGAAILAAGACARAGAGVVALRSDPVTLQAVIARTPSVMGEPATAATPAPAGPAGPSAVARTEQQRPTTCLLIGPGLAPDDLDAIHHRVVTWPGPAVVDASALRAICTSPAAAEAVSRRSAPTILTPHPGELAALVGGSLADALADLPGAARVAAARYRAVVIAKSAGAFVTDGVSERWIHGAQPALASAGSGDVLAGITAALLTRHAPLDAACLAAWIHVTAADAVAAPSGPDGVVASDLLDAIPGILGRLREART